jgi:hypothetical protein
MLGRMRPIAGYNDDGRERLYIRKLRWRLPYHLGVQLRFMQVLSTDIRRSVGIGCLFLAALIGDMELSHLLSARAFTN